jgi:hypothetical protein
MKQLGRILLIVLGLGGLAAAWPTVNGYLAH